MKKRLEKLSHDLWRMTPCRLAEKLTNGKFVRYRHIDFLSRKIAQAVMSGNARLVISMPPRHGKSWLTSIYTPAWYLSLFPERSIILASYESSFAASWGRQVRNVIHEHCGTLGVRLADDSSAADHFHTTEGGSMTTAGVGSAITGRGFFLGAVDDFCKNWEEAMSETARRKTLDWFYSTFYTRGEPGSSIIVLATRWHEDDLIGHLLSKKNETGDAWEEIGLPALAEENDLLGRSVGQALCPERYDIEALEKIRQAIGTRMFSALYQQRPSPEQGNLLRREWFKYYSVLPTRFDEVIQSWDLASKDSINSDFCVGQCWGRIGSQKYLIDSVRMRMNFVQAIQSIRAFSEKHPEARTIVIEEKSSGPCAIAALSKEISGIVPYNPRDSKVGRVNSISPQFESGSIFFPEPQLHSWVNDLIEELVSFPHSRFDDQTDALSQALLRLEDGVDTSSLAIYSSYQDWVKNRGYHPLNQKNFSQEVRRAFSSASLSDNAVRLIHGGRGHVWLGLREKT